MKIKSLSTLTFGLLAMQLVVPNFDASEITKSETQQTTVEYALANPTQTQVKAAAPTDIVIFDDANLEAQIATQLGVAVGEITVEKMQTLYTLEAPDSGITDLTGLEYAVNISSISMDNNNISDLTPIAGLTNLTDISLSNNMISDLSPISELTNLYLISMSNNQITDLTPISNLTQLGELYMNNNKISDLTPISGLTNLFELSMTNNNISDVSALSGLTNLFMYSLENQMINLPDLTVFESSEIIYNLIDVESNQIPITLGTPEPGINELSVRFDFEFFEENRMSFSGTIKQKVVYVTLKGLETASINEGNVHTVEQLINLFNIESVVGKNIQVDDSAINYNLAGSYPVTFEDGTESITAELTINDLQPTIDLINDTIKIKMGNTITDYITTFGVSATEIENGDLTSEIQVDDSAVNYNLVGTYPVNFTVEDNEGNNVSKTGNVVIDEESEVEIKDPVEPIKSEETDVETEVAIEAKATDKTEDVNKQTLKTTGGYLSITAMSLTLIGLVTLMFKKYMTNSHVE